MESLARAFDQPLDSPEQRDLAEHGWIVGEFVTVRYWLGRVLHRNLFREADEAVSNALHQYFIDQGAKGACIVSHRQLWSPLATLLRHHAELAIGNTHTTTSRKVAAIEAVMADPELNDTQLAALAKTIEKQIARMSDITVLRKLWRLRKFPIA